MHRFIFVFALLALSLGASAPAQAAGLPAVTLSVVPPASSGACPRTVDLRAFLHWVPAPPSPAVTNQYQFRVDGNPVAPAGMASVPAVGLQLHQPFTVTLANQGTHTAMFDFFINRSQPGIIAGETRFSATCERSANPGPTAGSHAMTLNSGSAVNSGNVGNAGSNSTALDILAVPPPYQLRRTTDDTECILHGGDMHCRDPQPFWMTVLVWEWKGNTNYPTIDGYRVYRSGHTISDMDIPSYLNQKITWYAWGKPQGSCFFVTAYSGARESAHSNLYCIPLTVEAPMPAH